MQCLFFYSNRAWSCSSSFHWAPMAPSCLCTSSQEAILQAFTPRPPAPGGRWALREGLSPSAWMEGLSQHRPLFSFGQRNGDTCTTSTLSTCKQVLQKVCKQSLRWNFLLEFCSFLIFSGNFFLRSKIYVQTNCKKTNKKKQFWDYNRNLNRDSVSDY